MGLFTGSSKGKLQLCDEKGKKKEEVSFDLNPSRYSISSNPSYRAKVGLGSGKGPQEFIMGPVRTLSAELIFDSTYEAMDSSILSASVGMIAYKFGENVDKPVTDKTKIIEKAVQVDGKLHKPPLVRFIWGKINFLGVVQNLGEEYTLFTPSGMPIRARVNLTMEEVEDPNGSVKKSPFESPDRTKSRVITDGMSLWSLAAEEYNDAEKWRLIASANHIMNPLDIYPGLEISIPALDGKER